MIISFNNFTPKLACGVKVFSGAKIIGEVCIDEGSSIWYNAVLRGDVAAIKIGKNTNIQDNCTVHVARAIYENAELKSERIDCVIGSGVTVGHNAILHACTVGDNVLVGMGSIIMDGASIGVNSIIAAGAVVTKNKSFAPNSLIVGSPARCVRSLSDSEVAAIAAQARDYCKLARLYDN